MYKVDTACADLAEHIAAYVGYVIYLIIFKHAKIRLVRVIQIGPTVRIEYCEPIYLDQLSKEEKKFIGARIHDLIEERYLENEKLIP